MSPSSAAPRPQAAIPQGERLSLLVLAGPELVPDAILEQVRRLGHPAQRADAPEALDAARPSAVLAELSQARYFTREDGSSPLPDGCLLMFVGESTDFDSRIVAARAGASVFLPVPPTAAELAERLDAISSAEREDPYRILIVEDSPSQALFYATVLGDKGMMVHTVHDPRSVLPAVEEFGPELILMDMYLPGYRGDDLARMVRQVEAFVTVPIVFLSAETDFDRQLAAMRLGGDEFLTKPIEGRQLVTAVTTRVERSRVLRGLMMQDSLTGAANHSRLLQQLEVEVARAARHRSALSFAMLDVDHFKSVNDRYGHPAGDRALKALAQLLRRRLRRTDVVGRYGGEEFAVVMPETGLEAATRVIDALRADFAEVAHECADGHFRVSFSAGVAAWSEGASPRALVGAADAALYRAKHAGRNRVIPAD